LGLEPYTLEDDAYTKFLHSLRRAKSNNLVVPVCEKKDRYIYDDEEERKREGVLDKVFGA
jgi:hypothetical protein